MRVYWDKSLPIALDKPWVCPACGSAELGTKHGEREGATTVFWCSCGACGALAFLVLDQFKGDARARLFAAPAEGERK